MGSSSFVFSPVFSPLSVLQGSGFGFGRLLTRLFWSLIFLVCVSGLVSLATWRVTDPSLNFARSGDIYNWLGYAGASFADISMQFFGLACVVLLFVPLSWSLLHTRELRPLRWRFLFWLFSFPFLSVSATLLLSDVSWPLRVGAGGVLGDVTVNLLTDIFVFEFSGIFSALTGWTFLVVGLGLVIFACNIHSGLPSSGVIVPNIDEADELAMESELGEYADIYDSGDRWSSLVTFLGFVHHHWFRVKMFLRRMLGLGISFPSPDIYELSASSLAPTSDITDESAPPVSAVSSSPRSIRVEPRVMTRPAGRSSRGRQESFFLPSLDLLASHEEPAIGSVPGDDMLKENAQALMGILEDFGVKGKIARVHPGPVVTLYELEPAPGIKSSRVIGLADDIARSMSAVAARVAVIPGRNAIGIELPNDHRETVFLREQLGSQTFSTSKAKLPMCLGKTIGGDSVVADLASMPHLLVAGTTGSGKSVAINTMILSLLYRHSPESCKMIMIDPKMLELSVYDGIPHLLTPVVVDPKKAVVALKWTVREMESRYRKMSKLGVRNIDGFNARVRDALSKGEPLRRTVQTGFDSDTGQAVHETEELDASPLPYIVVVIDEMADLMMVAGKDIEGTVQRLAQMARAAGIHVIMATQRPSVDVITGTIKANFPTRISFNVTSKIDSRTILGEIGAEQLLGMGDMLYTAGGGRIVRIHGPFVDEREVEDVVTHLKSQGIPEYLDSVTEDDESDGSSSLSVSDLSDSSGDLYDRAVSIVLTDRKASTSYVQRRLSIGYNRAATLIERMESEGIISEANHSGKREILVPEGEGA